MNNTQIGYLFSRTCKKTGIEDNSYNRILKFLGEDNLYWALVFCFTVYNKDNYVNIKKALDKIRIDILLDYHEILQKSLNNPTTDMDFITLIQSADSIRRITLSCCNREIQSQMEKVLKLGSKEEQDQELYKFQSELCSNDNLVIKNLIKKVEIITEKDKITNSELNEIYDLEMQRIPEYMLKVTCDIYNRYWTREEYIKNYEIISHKNDSICKQYHQNRGSFHREGKSLVKKV